MEIYDVKEKVRKSFINYNKNDSIIFISDFFDLSIGVVNSLVNEKNTKTKKLIG